MITEEFTKGSYQNRKLQRLDNEATLNHFRNRWLLLYESVNIHARTLYVIIVVIGNKSGSTAPFMLR
ncbi:hypothetical protein Cylst_6438 (plasmid) [Cylindrospermum stagnale PCC 7417]|uniref:Uncharacterized protein n=1 Tax=Cylindrospermum stagnale PCC 7417 TaxID=56107 RepID=K9X7Z2_9NOST|nr:hypothetical protein Cylst_6438 [Cylindrospermum stagnale PCC 7417]